MKYKLVYTKSYVRLARKFLKQHPDLEKQYASTLKLLEVNPFHPSLRLHRLKGRLKDLHAVSINIRYRILIHFIIREETIIPVSVGSHDEMYGK